MTDNLDYTNIVLKRLSCNRCGHTWWPKSERRPGNCPVCHSPYWDKPRVRPVKKIEEGVKMSMAQKAW